MGNEEIKNVNDVNESVAVDSNTIEEKLKNLKEFTVDNENILYPIYDIEVQEKLDNNMADGVDAFFMNEYEKAKEIFGKYPTDPIHLLGYGALDFMVALVTFDKEKIAKSLKSLDTIEKKASKQIDRINSDEKKAGNGGLMSKFQKKKGKKIINAKLRATVVKAECNLLAAALYLFQENVVSFVKAAFCLKKVWSGFYSCWNEIKDNLEESKKVMDKHTFNGILFGIGSSKLLLSVLPPKILSIISIFGISSDKKQGIELLNQCINEKNLYSPLALSAQLFYHCIYNSLAPSSVALDLESGEALLNKGLEMYPNSAVQLYFEGKFKRLVQDIDASTHSFVRANEAQNYFAELNHLFQYELVLNYILSQEWDKSIELLDTLIKDKYYSVISFTYLSGIIHLIKNDVEKAKELFSSALDIFKGQAKTIDIEQYCYAMIHLIEEDNYKDAEEAVLEFMYLWDGIPCMDEKRLAMALALRNTEEEGGEGEGEGGEGGVTGKTKTAEGGEATKSMKRNDSKASVASSSSSLSRMMSKKAVEKDYIYKLIKGSIYRELKRYDESEKLFQTIIDNKHLFPKKSFILPFTFFELGILYTKTKDYPKAQKCLGKIKSYKGFFMEFRLDVKLQKANEHLKELMGKEAISEEPENNKKGEATL